MHIFENHGPIGNEIFEVECETDVKAESTYTQVGITDQHMLTNYHMFSTVHDTKKDSA